MVNCEPLIVFERRIKEIVELVELGLLFLFFIHGWLTFTRLLNIKQFFETVVIIFKIQLLIVQHSSVESLRNEAELLTCVGFEELDALLFVFLALDDSLAVGFKFVEFVLKFCSFELVYPETIFSNRLLNSPDHLLLFLFEDLCDLFGDHFFFEAGTCLAQRSVDRVGGAGDSGCVGLT